MCNTFNLSADDISEKTRRIEDIFKETYRFIKKCEEVLLDEGEKLGSETAETIR
jgi:hypothetical protein